MYIALTVFFVLLILFALFALCRGLAWRNNGRSCCSRCGQTKCCCHQSSQHCKNGEHKSAGANDSKQDGHAADDVKASSNTSEAKLSKRKHKKRESQKPEQQQHQAAGGPEQTHQAAAQAPEHKHDHAPASADAKQEQKQQDQAPAPVPAPATPVAETQDAADAATETQTSSSSTEYELITGVTLDTMEKQTGSKDHGPRPHMAREESGPPVALKATPNSFATTSLNWSGYSALTSIKTPAANSVDAVSGTWTVPTISSSGKTHTYSSYWVGIDGFSSSTVEQIGTEHDWNNGKQVNYAWFEMYPGGAYVLNGFTINAGDSISASVVYMGNGQFQLTIANNTTHQYFVVPPQYTKSTTAKRSSAEWIVEAPYSGGILPLSHFSTTPWTNCMARIGGVTAAINNSTWQNVAITMVNTKGVPKATPSALSGNGQNWSDTWHSQ